MQTVEAGHDVVPREQWLTARKALLAREKELTHLRDEISRQRRDLPWEEVAKDYTFDGPAGRETLADLFGRSSQLIVYHFMFAPGWKEGCPGCSFLSDHLDGALQHVSQRDISMVAVSRAPLSDIEPFRKRMGWKFKWVSSNGGDFNYDFGVSFKAEDVAKGEGHYNFERSKLFGEEMPGLSVFAKGQNGQVFHTYSTYARGLENLLGAYSYIDLVPKGRDETGPNHNLGDWVRHHDRYANAQPEHTCCSGEHQSA